MKIKMLTDDTLFVFCETIASLHSLGVQTDEAVSVLANTTTDALLKTACDRIYVGLVGGKGFATSLKDSHAFPPFFVEVIQAGERAGRLEKALRNLAKYYGREDLLYRKARAALSHQAIVAAMVTAVLLIVTVVGLASFLPVSSGTAVASTASRLPLESFSLTAGWIALCAELLCGVLILVMGRAASSMAGWQRLARLMESMPFMRGPFLKMATERFSAALAAYLAAGIDGDDAFRRATNQIGHAELRRRLERILQDIHGALREKDILQAIADSSPFSPSYTSLLVVPMRSSSLESALDTLSTSVFDTSLTQVDAVTGCLKLSATALMATSAGALLIAGTLQLASLAGAGG